MQICSWTLTFILSLFLFLDLIMKISKAYKRKDNDIMNLVSILNLVLMKILLLCLHLSCLFFIVGIFKIRVSSILMFIKNHLEIFLKWEPWFGKSVVVTEILHFSYVPGEANASDQGTILCNVQQHLLQYAFPKTWFFFLQKHVLAHLKINDNH